MMSEPIFDRLALGGYSKNFKKNSHFDIRSISSQAGQRCGQTSKNNLTLTTVSNCRVTRIICYYYCTAQWDQIHKTLNFKKSFCHLENCKNINFCALKFTKKEILGPNIQKLKN